jgi:carbonic anhydrase
MKEILQGIIRYRVTELPALKAQFAGLSEGQAPSAIFFGCSDSRVIPSLMSSSDPGKLFEVRTVGNLIAPAGQNGMNSVSDESEAAAIEFGLAALGIDDIIVCGHSTCGAMKAALGSPIPKEAVNLGHWLRHVNPALERLQAGRSLDPSLPKADQLSQLNVLSQLEHAMSYTSVSQRVQAGTVRLHGLWFDIPHGEVLAFDPSVGRFVPVDEDVALRVASGLQWPPLGW